MPRNILALSDVFTPTSRYHHAICAVTVYALICFRLCAIITFNMRKNRRRVTRSSGVPLPQDSSDQAAAMAAFFLSVARARPASTSLPGHPAFLHDAPEHPCALLHSHPAMFMTYKLSHASLPHLQRILQWNIGV
jgi:hypothetical protein